MPNAIPPCVPATDLAGLRLLRRGKVRDVYEVDDAHLLLVSTDRVSAFDFVLEPAIPYKGAVLNAISAHWFRTLEGRAEAHFVTDRAAAMPEAAARHAALIEGRATLCRRAKIIPFECVVRGYLAGSAVKEYESTGTVAGARVGSGLKAGDRFPEPLFTPTTKAEAGHDLPVTRADIERAIGAERARELEARSIDLFREAARVADVRGLILVDSKIEWGVGPAGGLMLCDEIFTPDSSRYWLAAEWQAAVARRSASLEVGPAGLPEPLDKQVVRNYLLGTSWSREGPPPPLPPDVVIETARRYLRLHGLLTGRSL